jgi:TonB family protein
MAQSAGTSAPQGHTESAEVPIGVLEVPVGVWGSRRSVYVLGQPERIEVFAEETCTVIVFPHGAVIRLSASVHAGQMMMVANRKSRQVMLCRVVNIRSFPNVRGYAEIEFVGGANGFWGPYIPQGTLKLKGRIPSAVETALNCGTDVTKSESTQTWFPAPCAASPELIAIASTPAEDFWSSSIPQEVIPIFANAATPSSAFRPSVRNNVVSIERGAIQTPSVQKPAQGAAAATTAAESRFEAAERNVSKPNPFLSPAIANSSQLAVPSTQDQQRDESASSRSTRSWSRLLLGSFLGQRITRTSIDRAPFSRWGIAFVWIVVTLLFMMGTTGLFLLRPGTSKSDASTQTSPTPVASIVSPTANPMHSAQRETNSGSVIPELPIAQIENFPGTRARELADHVRISHPLARRAASEAKISNGKLLAPHFAGNRPVASIGRDLPPDLTGVDSNIGANAIQGTLAAFLPSGGRVKDPHLVFSSAPSYPPMARRAGIEGPVTIDAVIDPTGKLTSMKVVSGAPLLQQAALDSLRTWKYEPGYLNDKPVSVKTSITVKFRLQ